MSDEMNPAEAKVSLWHNRMFIVICLASVVVAVGIFILLINGYIIWGPIAWFLVKIGVFRNTEETRI